MDTVYLVGFVRFDSEFGVGYTMWLLADVLFCCGSGYC